MKTYTTPELKVAIKLSEMVNDLTLDLDQVGVYIAGSNSITYRRLQEVMSAAKWEKEDRLHGDDDDHYLF